MADDVQITSGSGTTIATDEISSKHYQRIKLIHGADGVNSGDVSSANPLPVTENGSVVSTSNSTTAPLSGSGSFVGTAEDVSKYGSIWITLATDVDGRFTSSYVSALHVEFSPDGTNWDQLYPREFFAGSPSPITFHLPVVNKYLRVSYFNGSSAQSYLRLQTNLSKAAFSGLTTSGSTGETKIVGRYTDQESIRVIPVISGGSLQIRDFTPPSNDEALVVRNIPSGTQTISGTVTVQDGGNVISVDDGSGSLTVDDGGSSITVDGTVAATQSGTWNITNVSGTVSLPTGASTSAKQDTGNTSLASIDGKITACNTGAVVVSSSALPSGAATAANQSTANTALSAIQTAVELLDNTVRAEDDASAGGHSGLVVLARRTDTPANQSGTDGDYEFLQVAGGRLWVDASGKTLTVDGSAVTQPVSAAALPLPTGAATSAKQDTIIGHLDGVEGLLTTIDADTGTLAGAVSGTEMQVDVVAALPTGANTIGAVNLAQYTPASGRLPVDGSGVTQPISAAALPLPTGAATAAKQPALGTAGSASADVLTVQGIASMTALKVDGSAVTQPVSGTVAATQSGTWTVSNSEPSKQTYVAQVRSTLTGSRHHLSILNGGSSTKVLKIWRVLVSQASEAAVTGVNTNFKLLPVSAVTSAGGSAVTVTKLDSNNAALDANVTVYSQSNSVTITAGSYFGNASLTSEETGVQGDPKILFDASSIYWQPIVLRAGQGVTVQQGGLTAAAGTVDVTIFFTQE